MRVARALLAIVLAALAAPASGSGATLRLASVGSFDEPVVVTAPPGDVHRIFVVEKTGAIRIVKDGSVLSTPFLDIGSLVSAGDEQGLLSMAFAPDYATSGRFYVDYTDKARGDSHVVEYRVGPNPDRANSGSARPVLFQAQPQANHNGGLLAFGPDGYLYIGFGDGGAGNDVGTGHNPTLGNGQDTTTQLGKILRIDPQHGSPYAVPRSNPFFGRAGYKSEIWDYGLRNPWRFSFDRSTGDLWIGDVGQGEFEEVDHERAGTGGLNYGWNRCEGAHAFDPSNALNPLAPPCTILGLTLPVLDYHHDAGRCAVTGGYVVRDPSLGSLFGSYVYGDFCSGEIWALPHGSTTPQKLALSVSTLSSFGEDACGHLYVTSLEGRVSRFETSTANPCTALSTPPTARAPALGLQTRPRVSTRGRVTVKVICPRTAVTACRGQLEIRHVSTIVAHSSFRVLAGSSRKFHPRLNARARSQLRRHGHLTVKLAASGSDSTRELRSAHARVRLRRP